MGAYVTSIAGTVLTALAAVYFYHRSAQPLASPVAEAVVAP